MSLIQGHEFGAAMAALRGDERSALREFERQMSDDMCDGYDLDAFAANEESWLDSRGDDMRHLMFSYSDREYQRVKRNCLDLLSRVSFGDNNGHNAELIASVVGLWIGSMIGNRDFRNGQVSSVVRFFTGDLLLNDSDNRRDVSGATIADDRQSAIDKARDFMSDKFGHKRPLTPVTAAMCAYRLINETDARNTDICRRYDQCRDKYRQDREDLVERMYKTVDKSDTISTTFAMAEEDLVSNLDSIHFGCISMRELSRDEIQAVRDKLERLRGEFVEKDAYLSVAKEGEDKTDAEAGVAECTRRIYETMVFEMPDGESRAAFSDFEDAVSSVDRTRMVLGRIDAFLDCADRAEEAYEHRREVCDRAVKTDDVEAANAAANMFYHDLLVSAHRLTNGGDVSVFFDESGRLSSDANKFISPATAKMMGETFGRDWMISGKCAELTEAFESYNRLFSDTVRLDSRYQRDRDRFSNEFDNLGESYVRAATALRRRMAYDGVSEHDCGQVMLNTYAKNEAYDVSVSSRYKETSAFSREGDGDRLRRMTKVDPVTGMATVTGMYTDDNGNRVTGTLFSPVINSVNEVDSREAVGMHVQDCMRRLMEDITNNGPVSGKAITDEQRVLMMSTVLDEVATWSEGLTSMDDARARSRFVPSSNLQYMGMRSSAMSDLLDCIRREADWGRPAWTEEDLTYLWQDVVEKFVDDERYAWIGAVSPEHGVSRGQHDHGRDFADRANETEHSRRRPRGVASRMSDLERDLGGQDYGR